MRPQSCIILLIVTLAVTNCQRGDTLSAVPSPDGTATLHHRLVGRATHIVCVETVLQGGCSERNADVIIDGVGDPASVRPEWLDNSTVRVSLRAGSLRRSAACSRDGRVQIEVVQG